MELVSKLPDWNDICKCTAKNIMMCFRYDWTGYECDKAARRQPFMECQMVAVTAA